MKVQLILFPQNFKGARAPLSDPPKEFIVGNSASSWGGTQYLNNVSPIGQPKVQSALTWFNAANYPINTWGRYGRVSNQFTLDFNGPCPSFLKFRFLQCGLYQKLSGLTVGDLYNVDVGIVSSLTYPTCGSVNSQGTWRVYHCTGNTINSVHTIAGLDIQSHQFTALSTNDILMFDWENPTPYDYVTETPQGALYSINVSSQTQLGNFDDFVANGQVICDLYEDEDIPMTFSIDDFKNVAEKVQSYSKAFKLPATKRNNQIFDLIFDVTRDTNAAFSPFNPYRITSAILKQDGFVLFEGYLRMLDIVDQDGEISYSVNLYSETIALKDLLTDRIFSDLDFSELRHDYNKTSIKYSWYISTGLPLLNPLPTTSYAYDVALGVNNTNVLKYPFVDWAHEYGVLAGNPRLLNLDNTFRPWLQLKYLINKIFEQTPFTWESNFFNTTQFENLFMDFNWEGRQIESGYGSFGIVSWTEICTTGTWMPIAITTNDFPAEAGYNETLGLFEATVDNTTYSIDWHFIARNSYGNPNTEYSWLHRDASGSIINSQYVTPWFSNGLNLFPQWQSSKQFILNQGDTLEFRIKQQSVGGTNCNLQYSNEMTVTVNQIVVGTDILAQTLRGELNQWEFLKGIMTMFNLISIPDKTDKAKIIFEPYGDVFINNTSSGNTSDLSLASRGIARDWTDKIDISEMKLAPLTDLKKTTKFVWEIDKDDYFYGKYSQSVNHDYGSLTFDASGFNVLDGEDEISGKPFAATLSKPIMSNYPDLCVPTIYQLTDDGVSKSFGNSPRIMYNNGIKTLGHTYYIPAQNGLFSENQNQFLQFSHLSNIPTIPSSLDYLWGEQQYSSPQMGGTSVNNLFNLYYRPYFNELYNADTKTMTIKVNLTPSDIATFNLYDTVFIKQREYRVNKINYKPNDLADVEFILIS